MIRRTAHTVRDHPTVPGAVQIDLNRGLWATIDRGDLDDVLAAGPWHVSFNRKRRDGTQGMAAVHAHVSLIEGGPKDKNAKRNLADFVLTLAGESRPEGQEPDHLNFNVLDNRRSNLRWLDAPTNWQRRRTA